MSKKKDRTSDERAVFDNPDLAKANHIGPHLLVWIIIIKRLRSM
jgi:hypothetical protein